MRKYWFILFVSCCSMVWSQANHKAAFDELKYQTAHPQEHLPYFKLGNLYSEIALTEHPICDYKELMTDLYNVRLFYGNCLHYAIDQNLKADEYLIIPHKGKKPTYQELQAYLSEKIYQAGEDRENLEKLYNSYYQLYDHYEQCRQLFGAFSEQYPREKMAHLLIDSAHYALLDKLSMLSDSVSDDIEQYISLLKKCPIKNYDPKFEWKDINLYRIDGLTKANLLVSEIPLWNYKKWVNSFMQEQKTLYADYNQSLLKEFIKEDGDKNLPNLINRLDYESFLRSWVLIRQEQRKIAKIAASSMITQKDDDYLENVLPVVWEQYERRYAIKEQETLLRNRINDADMHKYASLLDTLSLTTRATILQDAHKHVALADTAYTNLCRLVVTTSAIEPQEFKVYENEFTGEKIDQHLLTSLGITEIGTPVTVEQIGQLYMAVLANHKIVLFSDSAIYGEPTSFASSSPVLASYKLSSSTIAIIMQDDIIFVDNQGKIK